MFVTLTVVFGVLSVTLSTVLYFVTKSLLHTSDVLYGISDQIEKSLDVLDDNFNHMNEILNTPVASDDPYIRNVVDNIKKSREAILIVAEKLSNSLTKN